MLKSILKNILIYLREKITQLMKFYCLFSLNEIVPYSHIITTAVLSFKIKSVHYLYVRKREPQMISQQLFVQL